MYGLVNMAIQQLITKEHGEDVWKRIADQAQSPHVFVSMETYPDSVTYSLVTAASELLSVEPEELLRLLGDFWITYTGRAGYGTVFNMWGEDLRTFLRNLNPMHNRIRTMMPQLNPPEITAVDEADGRVRLIYRTHREGLAPMMIGLLEGLARIFENSISIDHVVKRADAGHDEFVVSIDDA